VTVENAALHRHPQRIAFYHVDAAGRIFFGRVYEFFIDAYHGFLRERRIDLGRYRSPVVHSHSDFMAPMVFGDEVVVEITTIKPGTSSMTIDYRVVSAADVTRVHCTGSTVHVFIDRQTHEKQPVPQELRDALLSVAGA
jgi:acyl-CoA thioesterase FadM